MSDVHRDESSDPSEALPEDPKSPPPKTDSGFWLALIFGAVILAIMLLGWLSD